MSEEKLYAVKNDEGKYWEFFDNSGFWALDISDSPITPSKDQAEQVADEQGGHVVTLVEEPEKVVITKEQAGIVEEARVSGIPATHISGHTDAYNGEERLLINAYVNGYTMAKEKKYNVKVPHTKEVWYYKSGDTDLLTIFPADKELRGTFTESEIEHYGLQDCEKEEVTDDDD
ncbi:DUF1642 domain-containing protein [Lacticaseibacillus paracasei]|uniref:DUF1642 domain-containing protein n=1 Tax=Lacticaseibacillus paracasei TaxID=1597 RepID=UPI00019C9FFA|nr:DUF1642 domain-containing protein [Lacticaseibacillus paracasei]EEI66727.1 hypothetical protein HMPREF0530_2979 [Lacticaseibacillus paracasei subsp. paracasei ATCC 25302 = DSM 5622 = JCM 8130]MBA4475379.1 DUF1642 domain-containing protein [Lacticaseibacillus paracasei]TDG87576.1 hypothetical protein C5L26_002818 [Lacticaseibacillus paracasei subsp. paracasei]BAN71079.1 hypothetical phage protein [Lacticaseibacillus paracasei subsp. paracasei]GEL32168.1 hypothetical protein LPA04_26290 [Lact